jgi:hypothetical protein
MIDIAVAWDAQLLWLRMGVSRQRSRHHGQVADCGQRVAADDRLDDIPDGTNDRSGWWADMVLQLASAPPAGDLIGSRLLVEIFCETMLPK